MMELHKMRPGTCERGIALILALLVLLLLSAIGMGMIMMSNTENSISSNFRDEQVAFFAARAGVEEVRDRLRANAPNSLTTSAFFTISPTPLPGAPNGVVYVTNPANGEADTPWLTTGNNYPDDEICKEVTCTGGVPTGSWYAPTQSASASYAAVPILAWKWVRIMAKSNKSNTGSTRVTSVDGTTSGQRVCWNGTNEVVSAGACPSGQTPIYEVTALAVTPRGSRRMWQAEFTPNLPISFPAAVAIIGGGQRQCQMQGGIVTGNDQASPPGPPVPGIGYTGSNAGCQSQSASITGGGSCTANPNICGGIPAGSFTPGATLTATINSIKAQADNTYTGNVPSPQNTNGTLGTAANPKTTVINSAGAVLNSVTGTGILLIDAGGQTQLEISGNMQWNGPVIIYSTAGQVQVQIDDGNGFINGALLMATNNSSAQIQFQFQTTGLAGGIKYNSSYNNLGNAGKPLNTVDSRELIY